MFVHIMLAFRLAKIKHWPAKGIEYMISSDDYFFNFKLKVQKNLWYFFLAMQAQRWHVFFVDSILTINRIFNLYTFIAATIREELLKSPFARWGWFSLYWCRSHTHKKENEISQVLIAKISLNYKPKYPKNF